MTAPDLDGRESGPARRPPDPVAVIETRPKRRPKLWLVCGIGAVALICAGLVAVLVGTRFVKAVRGRSLVISAEHRLARGDAAGARADLLKAEAVHRLSGRELEIWTDAAGALGDTSDKCLELFDRRLAAEPGDDRTRTQRGLLLAMRSRPGEAESEFRTVLANGVDTPDVRRGLALALTQQRRFDEALTEFDAAMASDPEQEGLRDSWILALANAGHIDRADDEAERNVASRPLSAEAWTTRGVVHRLAGRTDEAEAALLRALELDPDFEAARSALERLQAGDKPR